MVSQGQAFQCIGQASTVSFGHFRPGAPTVLFECVHVCFCAYMCVFSALIYQHACPLIMKVMIHEQMTYSRKKTQHNLLFTATLSSVIFDSFLLNTLSCDFFPAKCYYLTLKKNNFSLIFTSYFFPLRYATSLLAIRCYVGGDRGVKFV